MRPSTDNPVALAWFGAMMRAFLKMLPKKADAALARFKRRQKESREYQKARRAAKKLYAAESIAFDSKKGTFKHFWP